MNQIVTKNGPAAGIETIEAMRSIVVEHFMARFAAENSCGEEVTENYKKVLIDIVGNYIPNPPPVREIPKSWPREITKHHVQGDPNSGAIKIATLDAPGSGGANHAYEISGFDTTTNQSAHVHEKRLRIFFQNGTVPEKGHNGISIETLLAVSGDVLNSFQNGPFNSIDNAEALEHINAAIICLQRRTLKRMARHVEGKEVA